MGKRRGHSRGSGYDGDDLEFGRDESGRLEKMSSSSRRGGGGAMSVGHQTLLVGLFVFLFWRAYLTNPSPPLSCPVCQDCRALLEKVQGNGQFVENAESFNVQSPIEDSRGLGDGDDIRLITPNSNDDLPVKTGSRTNLDGDINPSEADAADTTAIRSRTVSNSSTTEESETRAELTQPEALPPSSPLVQSPDTAGNGSDQALYVAEQSIPIVVSVPPNDGGTGVPSVDVTTALTRPSENSATTGVTTIAVTNLPQPAMPLPDFQSAVFYGQEGGGHNQPDRIVFETFFKNPPLFGSGTFVEIGAQDGVTRSNTLFFEETLGWSGLLVEAATPNFEKLKDNQLKRRKRSQVAHSASCHTEQTVKFIGDGGTAGVVDKLAPAFTAKWSKFWKEPWNVEYEVPCEPSRNFVARAGIQTVDFLSIDVEGSELDVLETFDFDTVSVRVLVFETGMDVERDSTAQAYLFRKGFCHAFDVSTNQFWVKDPDFAKKACTNL